MADENTPAFYPRVGQNIAKNFRSAQPPAFIEDPRAMDLPQYGDVDLSVPTQANLEMSRRMAQRQADLKRQQERDRSPLEKVAGALQTGRLMGSALTQAINSMPTRIAKGDKAAEQFMQERMYQPTQPTAYEYAGDIGDFLEKLETQYKIPPVLPEAMALQYLTGPATSQAMRTAGRGAEQVGRKLESAMDPVVKGALEQGGLPREMALAMGQGTASNLDVWHGSPHKFPPTAKNPLGEFDATKMGTGEGAQAYGIGHYTAEAKDVAKTYQPRSPEYEEKLLNLYDKAQRQRNHPMMEVLEDAMLHRDPEEILAKFANTEDGYTPQHIKAAKDFATWYEKNPPEVGGLYKVDLSDEAILKMLDLDKPLSEQNESVKAVLLNHPDVLEHIAKSDQQRMRLNESHPVRLEKIPSAANPYDATRMTGSDVMSAIAQRSGMGERGAVEKQLKELGIPGIKYLDEGSRGATGSGKWQITNKDGTTSIMDFKPNDDVLESMGATASPYGTRNFVVFPGNEDLMNIIDRKKAGGKVSISNNPDSMMLELNNQKMKNGVPAYGGAGAIIKQGVKAGRMSRAEAEAAGLYHPVGVGVKLRRPVSEIDYKAVLNPNQPMVPERKVSPEALYKGAGIPLVGDSSRAGELITEIAGKKLEKPVELQGGMNFMRVNTFKDKPNKSASWASGTSVISDLNKKARIAADQAEEVYGLHTSMSPSGADFSSMPTKVLLAQFNPKAHDPVILDALDEEIRKLKPKFVGVRSPDLEQQLLGPGGGEMRKAFVTRLALKPFQDAGLPNVAEARYMVSHPELLDQPVGTVGGAIAKVNPLGTVIEDPVNVHYDYPTKQGGEYFAGFDVPMTTQEVFPEFFENRRAFNADKAGDLRAFDLSTPIQVFDQKWLDQVMPAYLKRRQELIGKKKGGAVKQPAAYIDGSEFWEAAQKYGIRDSMENLNKIVNLVNQGATVDDAARTVAGVVNKAEGGSVSGDDLILEERPL